MRRGNHAPASMWTRGSPCEAGQNTPVTAPQRPVLCLAKMSGNIDQMIKKDAQESVGMCRVVGADSIRTSLRLLLRGCARFVFTGSVALALGLAGACSREQTDPQSEPMASASERAAEEQERPGPTLDDYLSVMLVNAERAQHRDCISTIRDAQARVRSGASVMQAISEQPLGSFCGAHFSGTLPVTDNQPSDNGRRSTIHLSFFPTGEGGNPLGRSDLSSDETGLRIANLSLGMAYSDVGLLAAPAGSRWVCDPGDNPPFRSVFYKFSRMCSLLASPPSQTAWRDGNYNYQYTELVRVAPDFESARGLGIDVYFRADERAFRINYWVRGKDIATLVEEVSSKLGPPTSQGSCDGPECRATTWRTGQSTLSLAGPIPDPDNDLGKVVLSIDP